MKSRKAVLLAAVGVLVVIAIASATRANQPQLVGDVAGAPAYKWNEPFLDWPQTGDLPCETEEGPCGPPTPTLDPNLKAQGRPLSIAKVDVPVGKPGRHELELGELVLPNGFHSRTFFKITNGIPRSTGWHKRTSSFGRSNQAPPLSRNSPVIGPPSMDGARHGGPCLGRRLVFAGRDHVHRGPGC
jgi:hypothetical protein